MSSNYLRELFDTSNIRCDKWIIVRNGQEALAEFVRQEMESRNWSTYDIVRESGGLIKSNSTAWNVLNSRGKEVKDKTLRGLAKAFNVPEKNVFDIYLETTKGHEAENNRLLEMAHKFDALPEEKRPAIEPLIDVLNRELDRLAREN